MRLRRPRRVLAAAGLVVLVALICAGAVLASASSSRHAALPRVKSLTARDATRASVYSKDGTLAAETVQLKGYRAHLRTRRIHKPAHRLRAKTKAGRVTAVKAANAASASAGAKSVQPATETAAAKPALTKFSSPVEGLKFPGLEDNDIASDPLNLGEDLSADTEGVTGVKDYVEMVGFAYGVFDKSTGALLGGEDLQEFFDGSGLGAPCEKSAASGAAGYVSPHVIYDPQSDRYILMVNAEQNHEELGASTLCIGVSKTSDPVAGGWYYYAVPLFTGGQEEISHSAAGMWTNGVYLSEIIYCKEEIEKAKCPNLNTEDEFAGTQVWAFNRAELESGAALEFVTTQGVGVKEKDNFSGPRTEVTFSNKDAEGPVPANLAPGIALPPDSSEATKRNEYLLDSSDLGGLYKSNGLLDVWQWHVNWENPSEDWIGQSKEKQIDYQVTTPTYGVPNSDKVTAGTGEEEFEVGPIAGGHYSNDLKTEFDYVKPKPQYTNFSGTESLWLSKATMVCAAKGKECVTAPDRVRWQQLSLESANGAPVISAPKQTQDYAPAPTALNRWLPAIGVDKEGDMALGYSGADKEVFPSLFIAGQEKVEGTAEGKAAIESLPETEVDGGHGYQTGSSEDVKIDEFGPQSSMSLDPNGCELWFAGQTDVGSPTGAEGEDNAWATQVTAFHFAGCTAGAIATELSASGQGNQAAGAATLTAKLLAKATHSGIFGEKVAFTLGSRSVGTAITNSEGVATLTGVSYGSDPAGANTGVLSVSYAGDSSYNLEASTATGSLLIGATQTITFAELAGRTYGEGPFTISASASSKEAVSFTAAGSCSVMGETVTITGAGICTITATQPGNGSTVLAAPPVSQSFNIAKEPQTITATGTWTTNETVGTDFTASASSSVSLPCSYENNAACIYFATPEGEKNCTEAEAGETPQTQFLAKETKEYDEANKLPLCTVYAESAGSQNVAAAIQPVTVEITNKGTQTGKFAGTIKAKTTLTEIAEGVADPVTWTPSELATTSVVVTGTTSQGAIAAASTAAIGTEAVTGTVEKITDSTKGESGCATALATVTVKESGSAVDGLSPGEIVTIEKATKATYNVASTEVKTTPTTKTFTYCTAKASETEEKTGSTMKLVASIVVSGTTATAYVTAAPKTAFAAKQKVNIAGVKSTSATEFNNKTFEILSAPTTTSFTFAVKAGTTSGLNGTVGLPATGVAENEGVATVNLTTEPAAALSPGQEIEVANVAVTTYNGAFKVKEVLSAKSFTYEDAAAKESVASGAGELASGVAPCKYSLPEGIIKGENAGKCKIEAKQAGNQSYTPGAVTLELTIAGGVQSLKWSPEGGNVSSTAATEVSATTNSGLTPGTITSTTPAVCTVSNAKEAPKGTVTLTVTPVAEGKCILSASGNEGTPNEAALKATTKEFNVTNAGAAQTITFAEPKPVTLAQTPVTLAGTASSKLPVTYVSSTPAVCTTGGGHGETLTLLAEGFCKITAEQAGEAGVYAPATAVTREFRVAKADQLLILNAEAFSAVEYGSAGFELTGAKGAVSDNAYSPVVVTSGTPTGLTPSYEGLGACSVSGTKVQITSVGTCTIVVSQAGNAAYREAPQVTVAFAVTAPTFTIEKLQKLAGEGAYTKAPLTGEVGQVVDYEVIVKNTSGQSLKFGSLIDAGCTKLAPAGEKTIAAGHEQTYTCQHTFTAGGTYSNEAEIETGGAGTQASNAVVVKVAATASFTIEKLQKLEGEVSYTKSSLAGEIGGIVDYEVVVKNTGELPLKLSALTDANCAGISPAGEGELAPGSTTTYTCEHLLSEVGAYTNTASITGNEGTGTKSSNTVEVEVATNPGFSIEVLQKIAGESAYTTSTLTAQVGETVDYEAIVKNTGNTALVFKALSDANCSAITPSGEVEVARGGEKTYTCSLELAEAGTFTDSASIKGNQGTGTKTSNSVVVETQKAAQTITFANPGTQTYGEADFAVGATASSGLAVTYTTSGACTVSGGYVHLTAAGSCTVTAHQEGSGAFLAASPVSQSFAVEKENQTIDLTSPGKQTYGEASFTPSATATSGLPVSFKASGSCSISSGEVQITGAGSCTLTAEQAGNANFNVAKAVSQSFEIEKAEQTIAFTVGEHAYGESDFTISATATSGEPVSFTVETGQCTLSGDTVHLTGSGSCTIDANQEGNANYLPAEQVADTFRIATGGQTITFPAIATKEYGAPAFAPGASASSGLTVSYEAAGQCEITQANLVAVTGAGSCTVTAEQAGNEEFAPASAVQQTFTIEPAGQTISFTNPGTQTYGEAPFTPAAVASSGLPVSFNASGSCAIISGQVTITSAGECTITALQSGDSDYSAATPVSYTVHVEKAEQSIDFSVAEHTYGESDFTISATATSGEPVVFTVGTGECTVSGETVHLTGTGSCTIDANQAGNADYKPAAQVADTFRIDAASQTITFPAIQTKVFGEAAFAPGATASSKLPVSYAATGDCAIEGGQIKLTGAGSCTVTASQAGDSNFEPASAVEQTFTINKAAQAISFTQPAPIAYNSQPVQLKATASSGLAVTYSGVGACTVSTAGLVTPTAAGNCVITASQAGSGNYEAASSVTRTLVIEGIATTIKLTPAKRTTEVGKTIKFTAKVKPISKTQPPSGTVNFYLNGKLIDSQSLTSKGVEKYSYVVTLPASPTPYAAEAVFVSSTSSYSGSSSAVSHITVK